MLCIHIEVSINAIVEKEFDRAGYYVRNAYDAFLSTWTTLHPLAHGSRMAQLINLERVCVFVRIHCIAVMTHLDCF